MSDIVFEQPLSERIRNLLRLDLLFSKIDYYGKNNNEFDIHSAVSAIFDVMNILSRGDLRSEIIKELEKQITLNDTNNEDNKTNKNFAKHAILKQKLLSQHGQIGNHIRRNEFLNNIKQRGLLGGCANSFDLTGYHHWLNLSFDEKNRDILNWMEPFSNIRQAIIAVLGVVRKKAKFKKIIAKDGYYQQAITGKEELQLIMIKISQDIGIYPEISASKRTFSIRFFKRENIDTKAYQYTDDVPIKMACSIL
ncbi:MAG: cell division protein ZapD [Gammaproteobacteria bacterium]|nr:MAG: cell division protein ZapD [Gammaproteobacteria bacterium]